MIIFLILFFLHSGYGTLQPQDSETRQIKSLDGMWRFRLAPRLDPDLGFREKWYNQSLDKSCLDCGTEEVMPMPVPSSYNDITTNASIRDHVGWAWYDRYFYTPLDWMEGNVVNLRFGSVHYYARVYINGEFVGDHAGGHLPFDIEDINANLQFGKKNLITVAVNNTLNNASLPQGFISWKSSEDGNYPPGYFTNQYTFDFFNYAGIHRSVLLYTFPSTINIRDVTVTTTDVAEDGSRATLSYDVEYAVKEVEIDPLCVVELKDKKSEEIIASATGCSGSLSIDNPKLWWPYLMNEDYGHLHTLDVRISSPEIGDDIYTLTHVGIRSINWNSTNFMINHKNFYFRGFGRHEDSDIRGKGLDLPLIARDFNLIKWTGANSFRTSHYPYADEIMDMADEQGIAIIDECPGVNLHGYSDELLENHLKVMQELIDRDKNRASVVMWSIANEPKSILPRATEYFQTVAAFTKNTDRSKRPVTAALMFPPNVDKAAKYLDIVAYNRYDSWYYDTGHLELIQQQMELQILSWREKYPEKPFMITEYGGDTIPGLHALPSSVFSEEYQTELMINHFKAFDTSRERGGFIGEMIWNFADFMTKQDIKRVGGNKKGIFTRQRQPKASAHLMRNRYLRLAEKVDDFSIKGESNYDLVCSSY